MNEPVLESAYPITSPTDAADIVAKRALRKASLRLIPLIAVGYGMAYVDRVNISFAALQMNQDLHFSASMYGLGAGLFFVSYAACEIPSNLALYHFGAKRWLARIMITWGVLAMGMAFVKSPTQFYTMRFLLGVSEAGFFPGIIFYLTQWFPAHLRARAVSRFYVAMPLSSVVMGAAAGALLNLNGKLGLKGWQWIFLIEGLPAVLLSVVFLLYLPNGPVDAEWLTTEERGSILGMLEDDRQREGATDADKHNIGAALKDWRVWLMSVIFLLELGSNYAYTFSAPAILTETTHASATTVGWLLSGMNLIGAVCMLFNAIHSDRTRERYWHVIVPFLIMATGFALGGLAHQPWIVVPALALTVLTYSGIQGPLWAIPGGFLKDKSAAAGIATINMIGMMGGFLGPGWMGISKDLTGNYRVGLAALAVPCLMGAAMIFFLRYTAQKKASA